MLGSGEGGFAGFFDDLLGDAPHSLLEQLDGVAALGHLALAVLDGGVQFTQDTGAPVGVLVALGQTLERVEEARGVAGVAGRAVGINLQQNGVAVAVQPRFAKIKVIA